MKNWIISGLLSLALLAQVSPISASFAQTKIIIPSTTVASPDLRKQQISDFLKEYKIIERCLRNRSGQENKSASASVAVCGILSVFDESTISRTQSWSKAKQIQLIPADTKQQDKLKGIKFLEILFKASGTTVSHLAERNYRKIIQNLRMRLTKSEKKVLAIAFENGLIAQPLNRSSARRLSKELTRPIKIGQAFGYLWQVASSHHETPTIISIAPINDMVPTIPMEMSLKEIIKLIKEQSYYSDKFDEKKAMEAAIKAMVKTLDEDKYIEYYGEEDYKSLTSDLNGNLEGIGAYIEEQNGKILIVSPIIGSPAEAAGLRPGDMITRIDGESTEGLSLHQAVDKIRGPKGSEVILTIFRNNKTFDVSIIRGKIEVPSLTTSTEDGYDIIKLIQFNANSAKEMKEALEAIDASKSKGIIIDLRNNPGGFLEEVVDIVSFFVEKGQPIVYLQDKNDRVPMSRNADPIITDIPVSILINKGSASASEILSGTLQSYGKAKVFGETSFGKGTVQNILPLHDPSQLTPGGFKFTVSEYLIPLPDGDAYSIDGTGVKPNDNPGGPDDIITDNLDTPERDEAIEAIIRILGKDSNARSDGIRGR